MNIRVTPKTGYGILVEQLDGPVEAWNGQTLLARSTRAKVMYETRNEPIIYVPFDDIQTETSQFNDLSTFCPFKGVAQYRDLKLPGETLDNALWCYTTPLAEAREIDGYVGIAPNAVERWELGDNTLSPPDYGNIAGPLVDWLLRDAAFMDTPEDFMAGLVDTLQTHGVPISRLTVLAWALHPRIAGHHYIWEKHREGITTKTPSYEIHEKPEYKNSPLRHVSKGLGGLRYRLSEQMETDDFPILKDLRDLGATDYVAMPLPFSDGRINVLTLASDHPDGFSVADLGLIFECSAVIARHLEVFVQRENAQAVLETYVGKRSGARVLGGEIRRGDGDEIDAAIMFCDLRGSTQLEEQLPRGAYIDLLNLFFDTVSSIVHDHGGEVLKFIGDAVLAVFPSDTDPDRARANAMKSARAIVASLAVLPRRPDTRPIECAIGLAAGSVLYGNVGSHERLDFTVIGQAANVAARLGDLGKEAGHRIVVSQDLLPSADSQSAVDHAATCAEEATSDQIKPLGHVKLHNVSKPVVCFAVSADARSYQLD